MNPNVHSFSKLAPSATRMIRMDHAHVLATFHKFEASTAPAGKKAIVDTVSVALEIHAQLEEEVFYPALRAVMPEDEVLDKSVPEHAEMRRLIAELRSMQPDDRAYDGVFMELMRDVLLHVADEETRLLPLAERVLASRLGELGAQMTKRRLQLAATRSGEIAGNAVRSTSAATALLAVGGVLASTYLLRRAAQKRA
jgi:hypothetical protein